MINLKKYWPKKKKKKEYTGRTESGSGSGSRHGKPARAAVGIIKKSLFLVSHCCR
jgi:hypothetical protein